LDGIHTRKFPKNANPIMGWGNPPAIHEVYCEDIPSIFQRPAVDEGDPVPIDIEEYRGGTREKEGRESASNFAQGRIIA
jgi:hypothetical protein